MPRRRVTLPDPNLREIRTQANHGSLVQLVETWISVRATPIGRGKTCGCSVADACVGVCGLLEAQLTKHINHATVFSNNGGTT